MLLLDSQLCRRQSLEALVGNRLAALGGEAEGSRREPCLRALERRELGSEILCEARVELFLVEVLGASVAWFVLFGELLWAFLLQLGDRLLDPLPLAREQLWARSGSMSRGYRWRKPLTGWSVGALAGRYDEHRACGRAYYSVADAAHDQSVYAAAAMRPEEQQICVM